MEDWSESCGVSGLELQEGSPVRAVILDADYAEGPGPCAHYGLCNFPLAGVYAGKGNVQFPVDTPAESAAWSAWCDVAGFGARSDGMLLVKRLGSDKQLWLMSEAAYKFLPELPMYAAPGQPDRTVAQAAAEVIAQVREAVMPHVKGVVNGNDGDLYAASRLWTDISADDKALGALNVGGEMSSWHIENKANMEQLLAAYNDQLVLWHAMQQTRRMFVPVSNVGLPEGGSKAVSELARFTRRKAIHAGYAGQA